MVQALINLYDQIPGAKARWANLEINGQYYGVVVFEGSTFDESGNLRLFSVGNAGNGAESDAGNHGTMPDQTDTGVGNHDEHQA